MKRIGLVVLGVLLVCGCSEGGSEPEGEPQGRVTWYRDVLPIAQEACLSCHNDQAPTFSMARFSDGLATRAPLIADYTAAGVMPPWKPSGDCNSFHDERTLTSDQKAVFAAWADGGALEGDPADAPPELGTAPGLAWIDETLTMPEPYTPEPRADDPVNDLHCFVFDPGLTQTEQLIGFEVIPGERQVVHHGLIFLADGAEAVALDEADPGQGYSCTGGPGATTAQVIGGWVPGMPPSSYPEATGIPMAAGSMIIMQLHYNLAQAGALPDQSTLNLQYANSPVDKNADIMALRKGDFQIPPLAEGYAASQSFVSDVPGTIWATAPHMHNFGRQVKVEVLHDNGDSTCLLDIPDWDFNWQQLYFFDAQQGIPIEAGDEVKLTCTWDNTSERTVQWGDSTEDEMCINYFYVTRR